jgi:hypothetical protein
MFHVEHPSLAKTPPGIGVRIKTPEPARPETDITHHPFD